MLDVILLTIYVTSMVVSIVLLFTDRILFDNPNLTPNEWAIVAFEVLCPILNTIFAVTAIVIVAPQIAAVFFKEDQHGTENSNP